MLEKSKPEKKKPEKKRRSYGKAGDRLRQALKNDGIPNSYKVASILLDTFVKRSGVLKSAHVESKDLCDEGGFKVWRKQLQDKGWIIYNEEHARRTKRYSDHEAGYKLKLYINDAKAEFAEFATMDDIRSLQVEKADLSLVTELQARIEALEKQFGLAQEEVVSTKEFAAKAYRALKRQARSMLGPNASNEAVEGLVNEMINAEDDDASEAWTQIAN